MESEDVMALAKRVIADQQTLLLDQYIYDRNYDRWI